MAKKNKMKTKKAIAKRVKLTAGGKLKRHSAYRSHLAQNKTTKQKRHSEKARTVSASDQKRWAGLLQD